MNERLKQIQLEAEREADAKAQEIIKAVFGDDVKKLDVIRDGLSELEKANRDLQRQIDLLNIHAGLHMRIRIASVDGRVVDPIAALNGGVMIGRFGDR